MSDADPLPLISPGDINPVPVFSCHVILKNADGMVHARVANLAGIEAQGETERDALMAVSRLFKDTVMAQHKAGDEIPWLEPAIKAADDEYERFIPVHL